MSLLNDANGESVSKRRKVRSESVMQQFISILAEECERERSVEYYANRLDITPKYLTLICKNTMGRNASSIIDEAVVRKSKELLMQQGLSIKDIADRLNFVSQSFFGKYFKQRVGVSPSRYKIWDGRTEESIVNEDMLFNDALAANDNK